MQIRPDPLRFSIMAQDSLIFAKQTLDIPISLNLPFLSSSTFLTTDVTRFYSPFIIGFLKLSAFQFEIDHSFFSQLNFLVFSATLLFTTLTVRLLLRSTSLAVITLAVILSRGRMIQESYFVSEVNFATCFFAGAFSAFAHYMRTRYHPSFLLGVFFILLFAMCGDLYAQWFYVICLGFFITILWQRRNPISQKRQSFFDIKPASELWESFRQLKKSKVILVIGFLIVFLGQIIFKHFTVPDEHLSSLLQSIFFRIQPHGYEMFERSIYDLHFKLSLILIIIFYLINLRLLYNAHRIWKILSVLLFWIPLVAFVLSSGTWSPQLAMHFRIGEPLILALACGMSVEKLLLVTKKGLVFIKG